MPDLICPRHGPYNTPDGQCPFCKAERGGARPQAPRGLDDLATDPGGGTAFDEEAPTDPGTGARAPARGGADEDDAPTELPGLRAKRGRGPADGEDEIATELPARRGKFSAGDEDDHTEVLDHAREGLLGWLVAKNGRRRGKLYEIKNGSTLGRKSAAVLLDDRAVSDPHAKVTVEDGKFVVWDFGSANGTFVNGERIRGATVLKENDEIKMGETILVVKVLE